MYKWKEMEKSSKGDNKGKTAERKRKRKNEERNDRQYNRIAERKALPTNYNVYMTTRSKDRKKTAPNNKITTKDKKKSTTS